jgi:2'-5' RNA ligase
MTDEIHSIYEMLWNENFESISRGDVDIDPYITDPASDQRRGLTLRFRPSPEVMQSILDFLGEIRAIEPGQFYYNHENLHFTVLSLFTAIPECQNEFDRLPAYEAAVTEVLEGMPPFSIHLIGITASRSAVMVCGYPQSGTLNDIRQRLRRNLNHAGLSQGLDVRYTLTAAHTTVMRFSSPLLKSGQFCEFLQKNKHREFGWLDVSIFELTKNDWYMSLQHTQVLNRYTLIKANESGEK